MAPEHHKLKAVVTQNNKQNNSTNMEQKEEYIGCPPTRFTRPARRPRSTG